MTITFRLPFLVLKEIRLNEYSTGKDNLADTIIDADTDGPNQCDKWNYQSVTSKLSYIANFIRLDISMATHQFA
jgi:hypothetical protein